MTDFASARRTMVDSQIRPADVTDIRLLDAFIDTPREAFLPDARRSLAYLDLDLAVKDGSPPRCIMQPMVLARLMQAAAIGPEDRILDVGSATGYSSALLACLGKDVVALESDGELADFAKRALAGQGNVRCVTGDLEKGHAAGAPYDVVLLQGSVETVPSPLTAQLAEGGRLMAVVGYGRVGRATVFVKSRGEVAGRIAFDASVAPLPGFRKAAAFAF